MGETKFCLSLGGIPHRSYLVASRGGEMFDIERLSDVATNNGECFVDGALNIPEML